MNPRVFTYSWCISCHDSQSYGEILNTRSHLPLSSTAHTLKAWALANLSSLVTDGSDPDSHPHSCSQQVLSFHYLPAAFSRGPCFYSSPLKSFSRSERFTWSMQASFLHKYIFSRSYTGPTSHNTYRLLSCFSG